MKKLILLLSLAVSASGAEYEMTYVQKDATNTPRNRVVLLTPNNVMYINATGQLAVESVSAFRTRIGAQASDDTLAALASYNANGFVTQTAADTFTGRVITGTAGEITVTNGNGVSGNPTLELPSTITQNTTFTGSSAFDNLITSTFSVTPTSGITRRFRVSGNFVPTATSTATVRGHEIEINNTGAFHSGSSLVGGYFSAGSEITAGTTNLIGFGAVIYNGGSGGGAITTATGADITFVGTTNPVTTAYGIRIGNVLGSTDYGIYQSDSSDDNFFAGAIGIGAVPAAGYLLDLSKAGAGDLFRIRNTTNSVDCRWFVGTNYSAVYNNSNHSLRFGMNNDTGRLVVDSSAITLSAASHMAQELLFYSSGNDRYGIGSAADELRLFVPSTVATKGVQVGAISGADGATWYPNVSFPAPGGLRFEVDKGVGNYRGIAGGAFRQTADATPSDLSIDGNAPGATNRVFVPTGQTYAVICKIAARQESGTNSAIFVRQFLVANNAGTTALVGTVNTVGVDINPAGWTVPAISADDTNDAISISVTGVAATNIRWLATLDISQIAY